jgi:hypothetical protein
MLLILNETQGRQFTTLFTNKLADNALGTADGSSDVDDLFKGAISNI